MNIVESLSYDDVLLVPGHSDVLPHTADVRTRLSDMDSFRKNQCSH